MTSMTRADHRATHYASLVGPLLGLYYPLPNGLNRVQQGIALNTSRLKSLWCSIYTKDQVQGHLSEYGGAMLPDEFAQKLDYDSHEVNKGKSQ